MFHVFTFLSGIPYERGSFIQRDAAIKLQAELHAQGWYFVPVLSTAQALAEKYILPADTAPELRAAWNAVMHRTERT